MALAGAPARGESMAGGARLPTGEIRGAAAGKEGLGGTLLSKFGAVQYSEAQCSATQCDSMQERVSGKVFSAKLHGPWQHWIQSY